VNKSLTIVLPVHNAESRLRRNVNELLELASELTAKFGVLIIDDGSTDATFEVAEELASHYPQVSVRRHRHCLGLGATIDYAQRRVRSDAVIVHDGVTPINSHQMRRLWQQWAGHPLPHDSAAPPAEIEMRDLGDLAALQRRIETAHRRASGFQLLTPLALDDLSEDASVALSERPIAKSRHLPHRVGVGGIPELPRPKFLRRLAEFALGE
jgi:cellulose synthase/poly-beta-1,6-N-acetylglucosamine synthase-like glycosyltransferase